MLLSGAGYPEAETNEMCFQTLRVFDCSEHCSCRKVEAKSPQSRIFYSANVIHGEGYPLPVKGKTRFHCLEE